MKPSNDTQLVTLYPRQCTGCTRTYKTMRPNSPFCSNTCMELNTRNRQPITATQSEPVTIELELYPRSRRAIADWRYHVINKKINRYAKLNVAKLMESDIE